MMRSLPRTIAVITVAHRNIRNCTSHNPLGPLDSACILGACWHAACGRNGWRVKSNAHLRCSASLCVAAGGKAKVRLGTRFALALAHFAADDALGSLDLANATQRSAASTTYKWWLQALSPHFSSFFLIIVYTCNSVYNWYTRRVNQNLACFLDFASLKNTKNIWQVALILLVVKNQDDHVFFRKYAKITPFQALKILKK